MLKACEDKLKLPQLTGIGRDAPTSPPIRVRASLTPRAVTIPPSRFWLALCAAASRDMPSPPPSPSPWLEQRGVYLDASAVSIAPSLTCGGLGVVAVAPIAIHSVICRIPKTCILSCENSAVDLSDLLQCDNGVVDENTRLATCVMLERACGPRSFFHGYIQSMLPAPRQPMFWTHSALALLEGTELESSADTDLQELERTWEEISAFVKKEAARLGADDNQVNRKAFAEALSLVQSRQFFVDEEHGSSLVPLADIFNHKTARIQLAKNVHVEREHSEGGMSDGDDDDDDDETQVGHIVDDDEQFSARGSSVRLTRKSASEGLDMAVFQDDENLAIVTQRPFDAGEEIYNCYGECSNATLLHDYAFLSENNPFDIVNLDGELLVEVAADVHGERVARRAARKYLSQLDDYFELPTSTEYVPADLLLALKALSGADVDVSSAQEPEALDALGREEAELLARCAQARLQRYPELPQGDDDAAMRDARTPEAVAALSLRALEKKLLVRWEVASRRRASRALRRRKRGRDEA